MPLTTEQLMETMALVDEILDCNARLYVTLDDQRRAQLRSSRAARVDQIKQVFEGGGRSEAA
jgi:nanoRNase/pAp phosphatase (c-di-AMP/oligoRNAs hydrolase)